MQGVIDGHKSKLQAIDHSVKYPFIVFVGSLEAIHQAYLVVNDLQYVYKDPLNAVQDCLQIYIGLNSYPPLTRKVWHCIVKLVYKIKPKDCFALVTQFVLKVKNID